MADSACASRDENSRALHGTCKEHRLVGGVGWNAETCPRFHAHIGGECYGLFGRQRDRLGCGAESTPPLAVPDPDSLAETSG